LSAGDQFLSFGSSEKGLRMSNHLFYAKAYLALFIAMLSPYLPVLEASVRRSAYIAKQNDTFATKTQLADLSLTNQACLSDPCAEVQLLRGLNLDVEFLSQEGPVPEAKIANAIRFLKAVDRLSLVYGLSAELVEFRSRLAKRIGYESPLCAAVAVAGGLGLIVIGFLVIVAVVSVIAIVTEGGTRDPLEGPREAIEEAIREAHRWIEINTELLQSATSAGTIAELEALIAAGWAEIDALLQQLWDLLHPGDGRYVKALQAWTVWEE
jgi:hypothetical protein